MTFDLSMAVDSKRMLLSTDILGLEVHPGKLLRLTSKTSEEQFLACARRRDWRGTSGHLASLVITRGSNAPLALLANHVKTSLFQAAAPGGPPGEGAAPFVLHCLTALPPVIAAAVASQVFLDPLTEVLGQARSKAALLLEASSPQQLSCLHRLGLMLGVTEWSRDFEAKRTLPPTECLSRPVEFDLGYEQEDPTDADDKEEEEEDLIALSDEEVEPLGSASSDLSGQFTFVF